LGTSPSHDPAVARITARPDGRAYGIGLGVILLDDVYPGFPGDVRNRDAEVLVQGVAWRARALQVELGGHWPPPNPPEQRRILREYISRLCCPRDA